MTYWHKARPPGWIWFLVGVLTAAGLQSVGEAASFGVQHAPYQTSNWSGYVARGYYYEASGTWTVPTVTCDPTVPPTTPVSYGAWVGMDGYGTKTVEQTGTESACVNGIPAYSGWYEYYPAPPITITTITVAPGDMMFGRVIWRKTSVRLVLKDLTNGGYFSIRKNGAFIGYGAEWITEVPGCPKCATQPIAPLTVTPTTFFVTSFGKKWTQTNMNGFTVSTRVNDSFTVTKNA